MRQVTYLSLAIAFFMMLGCGPYKTGQRKSPMQETERVLLLDHGLTYYLKVVKQASTRLEGGQLEVKVEISNEWDKDVWVDVQTIFRGEDGFEVEKIDWEPFLFPRRTVTLFKKNSLSPKATDYRILIRNVKKS